MAIPTPGSVNKQSGDPVYRGGSHARKGGKNQGKVSGTTRRYSAHPRKRGQ